MSEALSERQSLDVDIACVGFGPAMGGFLSTLSKELAEKQQDPAFQSKSMPGAPLQVMCYERADDLGFGVSGVVTRARAIKENYGAEDLRQVPMAQEVKEEKLIYLLDPHGASRRSALLRFVDAAIKKLGGILPYSDFGFTLPFTPPFLHKGDGFIFSLGQFNQWVGSQLMGTGLVQIWPGMPVASPLIEQNQVKGIRLSDQGVTKAGAPDAGYMPGMDVKAALTVVGDGPVGAIGQKLNEHFGLPPGNMQRDWAVGMKMVVELAETSDLKPGMVLHTFGYPEPEIFGFLYVHQDRLASLGIFVPATFDNPVRTSYRYLQHWITHPHMWRYLKGSVMKSWGAKTLLESGRRGEPYLAGDGYARIGEGSGSTNVLTGSGVDEAWATGRCLAQAVIELLAKNLPFTKDNLEKTYVAKRRAGVFEREALVAQSARDGFQSGFIQGMLGMGLTWLSRGTLSLGSDPKRPWDHVSKLEKYFAGRIAQAELKAIREECARENTPLHDRLMDRLGWPKIDYDGKLLVSHQDALIMGGKVQAAAGFADHVQFLDSAVCGKCGEKVCIELCSAQAIAPGQGGLPAFDREKCVHCGACLWNCAQPRPGDSERANISFTAGSGGLHSAIN
jgi:electron-transferring-flavoprotein dehydrogenase